MMTVVVSRLLLSGATDGARVFVSYGGAPPENHLDDEIQSHTPWASYIEMDSKDYHARRSRIRP